MPFVLDASVAACWALADGEDPVAEQAMQRMGSDTAVVPHLWWFEIRNILVINERRGRIVVEATTAFLRLLAKLRIAEDHGPQDDAVLAFARRHHLTVYDAAYLELARRTGTAFATLDRQLGAAATAEGVKLIGSA